MDPSEAVKNIIAAHGGEDFWNGLESLEAEISVSGLLFTIKRRPVLDHVYSFDDNWQLKRLDYVAQVVGG